MISSLLFSVSMGLIMLANPPTTPEDTADLADTIVRVGCRGHHPTRAMVDELLAIEIKAGFPAVARGLVAAAACNESGFNPYAKGDWYSQISAQRRRCRRGADECAPSSLGMFQLGSWSKKGLRRMGATTPEPRYDWRTSARFWAKHVVAQVRRVRQVCPTVQRGWSKNTPERDVWRAAHRTAVVKPKCHRYKRGRCVKFIPRCHRLGKRYKSSHWRILATWRDRPQEKAPEKWKGIPRAVNPPVKAAVNP